MIFDLNSAKLAPIDAIAAMKAEPDAADDPNARLRVSRDSETIERARGAGSIRSWRDRPSPTTRAKS